jgi:hypothetical protein
MNEKNFHSIMALLSAHLFTECNELYIKNLGQVHALIDILVKANITFTLTFSESTHKYPKRFTLEINMTPTTSIKKNYQLEEGGL